MTPHGEARREFEEWAFRKWNQNISFARYGDGTNRPDDYYSRTTQRLWETWQAALQAPARGEVVVARGEYVNGRVYPDDDKAAYVALGRRLKEFDDGKHVEVIVREVKP